jgi:hypothetical protein
MCLISHWQIICSTRDNLLVMTISLREIKEKTILYISTHTYIHIYRIVFWKYCYHLSEPILNLFLHTLKIWRYSVGFFYSSLMNLLVQNFSGTCLESPLTDNLQYQRQFVGNDNITQRDQRKNCANASG